MNKSTFFILYSLLLGMSFRGGAQVSSLTLRQLVTLKNPSPNATYRITDAGKQGEWRYDPTDTQSSPNIGTILQSSSREVKGRYKRIYSPSKGVMIEWFMNNTDRSVNEALLYALMACDKINFGAKTYFLQPLIITPKNLFNPKRLTLDFENTTLQTQNGVNQIKILQLEDIPELTLSGSLLLNGNTQNLKIANAKNEAGQAFLQIISPAHQPKSRLSIGSLTFKNMPMCGINIDTRDQVKDIGYDRIQVKAFREINGFNCLNIQEENFAVWGVNVRGAHRAVIIDSLYTQQDQVLWGDAPIEKPFYTFTFENQVDPEVHKRKDSLYIKNIYARFPCSLVFYTQAVNHVRVDNYVIDSALRKPGISDAKAYPTMMNKNLSWVASKHTWTSFKSPKSSFYVKKLLIQNTNPVFMSEAALNDMTGLWLNKGITGAVFDEIETDVRLKFYGDGYYFGFPNVPDGKHRVGKFVCRIPAKKNYVQPLNADLTIKHLHIAKGAGVKFAMGNCKIENITQDKGTVVEFENRENVFKNENTLYNGFIVEACEATDILWKFNWSIQQPQITQNESINTGERYEFKNFSGNNRLQTHTTVVAPDGQSTYMTAYRYDNDPNLRNTVEAFVPFVEFNWKNVKMKLVESSSNDLTRRYLPVASKQSLLMNQRKEARTKGWKKTLNPSSFVNCSITP